MYEHTDEWNPATPLTDAWLRQYGAFLHSRIGEAAIVQRVQIEPREWGPLPNHCHDNADLYASEAPDRSVIRGWICMDFRMIHPPFFLFTAHSVVREPTGALVDITPTDVPREYPFLAADLPDPHFGSIGDHCIEQVGRAQFRHYL